MNLPQSNLVLSNKITFRDISTDVNYMQNNMETSQTSARLDAVIIRNLTYEVGRGSNRKLILNNINMTVPEGSIYGLLGPSGCGKTTMLRCVVGRIKTTKLGTVLVFGCPPNAPNAKIPGRSVGYMPQEISIYEDFTIEETLQYFGRINRMTSDNIRTRIDFLLKFLDLPTKPRLVVNLSGGQKRRVSLAAAIVHSPPLLILDEPTVGVDPLLRQSIWKHLVTLTQTERISVIITTHYIEEARQANVIGLMRHGKLLAEASPAKLMSEHNLNNLEDVFLKLCATDSAKKASELATITSNKFTTSKQQKLSSKSQVITKHKNYTTHLHLEQNNVSLSLKSFDSNSFYGDNAEDHNQNPQNQTQSKTIHLKDMSFANEGIEVLSSEDDDSDNFKQAGKGCNAENDNNVVDSSIEQTNVKSVVSSQTYGLARATGGLVNNGVPASDRLTNSSLSEEQYLSRQVLGWRARRSGFNTITSPSHLSGTTISKHKGKLSQVSKVQPSLGLAHDDNSKEIQHWFETLMAVTWKNYVRLRRNPPVLVFQFMLPAIQVFLFCLCIGGEPFDVPLAVVNDEVKPQSSTQFLNGLNKKVIRQIKYDNLTSAIDAVRRGEVWGALHIPDKYSQNLQSRLIAGDEATSETISNGTIRVYPDLTNLHLALALEATFRDSFINFARNSLDNLGYDKALADIPIKIGKPIYGSIKKDGYLEFMAPGVVISISYVMATGLTALAFILERRDGLLERSLISGVQTSQILLAHAINQVVVMIIQIFMVLGCVFFVFEIPSRGPFGWVVLLILLQGCAGMGFGLLVSAICREENTAVMMLVGTFYTNLILAGIIWPIEAMPHWLRPLSWAQPQTFATDTLRHILSRGWGITDASVLLGFVVTLGWLAIFLIAAGLIFKYYG